MLGESRPLFIRDAQFTPLFSVVAAKGILYSAIATGVLGFITAILFLFCTPDLDTLFALEAPQPFVQVYAMALGKGGSIFMTIIAVIGLILVCTFAFTAYCRLILIIPEYECLCCRLISSCL